MSSKTNLITSFVRRINKAYNSTTSTWYRPNAAEPGTNHIDNPALFNNETIYKAEEIFDLDKGRAYTNDGAEIIEPNAPKAILNGLLVRKPNSGISGSPLWLTVESGTARINGKTYWHEQSNTLGDIQLEPNTSLSLARYDVITYKSDYPNTFGTTGTEYKGQFQVYTGDLHNVGRPISFVGNISTSTDLYFALGTGTVKGIVLGDTISGPGIAPGTTATGIYPYKITLSQSSTGTQLNGKYAVAINNFGNQLGFNATLSAGSFTITDLTPYSGLSAGMLINGEGLPTGTIIESIGSGTGSISQPATSSGNFFLTVGDVSDYLITYPPSIPSDEIVLAAVFVPANYGNSSSHMLRPFSVSNYTSTFELQEQTPADIIWSQMNSEQVYTSDRSWVSDSVLLDRNSHIIYQVVNNHYSNNLNSSVYYGNMIAIAGGGLIGPQGPQGIPGGPTGPAGQTGVTGATGPQGNPGTKGNTGATGPQGNQGNAGPQGPQGAQGYQGAYGPTGIQGYQGNQGPTGANSTVPGPQGPHGAVGVQGAQGTGGKTGPQGIQGPTGAQGFQGTQGATGAIGTIQLTITTSSDFTTSDLISGLSQNGRHIIIDNGNSNINVDISSNVTASYQVVGTGTVTFTALSSLLQAPSGAVINTQYGSAAVSYFSTKKIVLVNNV